jgi:hypothetical protein
VGPFEAARNLLMALGIAQEVFSRDVQLDQRAQKQLGIPDGFAWILKYLFFIIYFSMLHFF